ncbi:MAG: hypothetical protein WCJ02_09440 [bacterium]
MSERNKPNGNFFPTNLREAACVFADGIPSSFITQKHTRQEWSPRKQT